MVNLFSLLALIYLGGGLTTEQSSPIIRNPSLDEVTPIEQQNWIDVNLPKLVNEMRRSNAVRSKVANGVAIDTGRPLLFASATTGLSAPDLTRLTATVNEAVSANRRYGVGVRDHGVPSVVSMPRCHMVRGDFAYPAPAPSSKLEPQPLKVHAWVCPDRLTAVALYWLRDTGFYVLDTSDSKTISIIVDLFEGPSGNFKPGERPPGEVAYWAFSKMGMAGVSIKGQKNLPPDRLVFLRENLVIEAITDEFAWNPGLKKWVTDHLEDCAPDVMQIMTNIDRGLTNH